MTHPTIRSLLVPFALAFALCACNTTQPTSDMEQPSENGISIQYLEIVTPDVDATCASLASQHGVEFGDPIAEFGNARTAALNGGGRIGVRAPMREDEMPVVRPYRLVDDIEAAVAAAEAGGGQIALPPMQMPGEGMFAIYLQGGIEHGLWMK